MQFFKVLTSVFLYFFILTNESCEHSAKTDNYHPPQIPFMKRIILITGTPCVGKTTIATALAEKIEAKYINLTEFAKTNNLALNQDNERNTTIINEEEMKQKLLETIDASQNSNIIIDGHYASAVIPTQYVTLVFVLRRNPIELKEFMERRGYTGSKLWENLQAEIIDVCLGEAVELHAGRVCELDVTGETVEKVLSDIFDVLERRRSRSVGVVDWIGILEREGLLDRYLKT